MVNYEIIYGIKAALERGQSLRSAMVSFFNAGYSREEIEEAARTLVEVGTNPNAEPMQVTPSVSNQIQPQTKQVIAKPAAVQKVIQPPPYIPPSVSRPINAITNPPKVTPQKPIVIQQKPKEEEKIKPKISDYRTPVKRKNSPIIIILVIFLVIFGGLLVSIFLFKQQLIDWLSTMF